MIRNRMLAPLTLLILASLACSVFGVSLPPASDPDAREPASSGLDLEPLNDPNPLNVSVTKEDRNSSEQLVFPDQGAILSATGSSGIEYALEIPAGALLSPTRIRMTPVSDMGGLPDGVEFAAAVHLEPEGLVLMAPASLAISLPSGVPTENLRSVTTRAGGRDLHLTAHYQTQQQFVIPVLHFSSPALVNDQKNTVNSIRNEHPTSNAGSNEHSAAVEIVMETIHDNRVPNYAKVADHHERWYREIVEPNLSRAGSDDSILERSLSEYLQWKESATVMLNDSPIIQQHPRDDAAWSRIQAMIDEARELLADALVNAIEQSYDRCRANNDPAETGRLMRWVLVIGGLDLGELVEERGLSKDETVDMLKDCARFKIFFHSTIDLETEHGIFHSELSLAEPNIEHGTLSVTENVYGWEFWGEDVLQYQEFSLTPPPPDCVTFGEDGAVEYSLHLDVNLNYAEPEDQGPRELILIFTFVDPPTEQVECPESGLRPAIVSGWLTSFTINHGGGDPTHLRPYNLYIPVTDECSGNLSGSCIYAEEEWQPEATAIHNQVIREETIVRITHHPR